jgi:hypothetical protein
MAHVGSARREGARAALELGATRGVKCSRRWRGAVGNSGERQNRGTEERQRKKRDGGVRGTSLEFSKISGTPLRSKISH